jgi:hypothetical protein
MYMKATVLKTVSVAAFVFAAITPVFGDFTDGRTQYDTPTPKVRKHDWYITPKYVLPISGMPSIGAFYLESGLLLRNGMFFGIDGILGVELDEDAAHNGSIMGGGLNWGGVYDLPIEYMKLVYGGAGGFWAVIESDSDNDKNSANFMAPFVKIRWKFVEISYRGLLGIMSSKAYKDTFGWNHHQIMLGVYFETSNRVRK